eukprot:TRINITY_DN2353_c0_g1_i3.p1 TRINITY_DN2353_c0_g1~~TRINITY_DN2353_c0_g1_i3.p1  ORF type:complete len:198 (+),score=105.65 TRINITY_DN2353_c0_g1_i3:129-722(+)
MSTNDEYLAKEEERLAKSLRKASAGKTNEPNKKKWEAEAEERKKFAEQVKAEEERKKKEAIEKLKAERSVRGEDIPDAVSHNVGGGGVVFETQVPYVADEAEREEKLKLEEKRLGRNIAKGEKVDLEEVARKEREAEEKRQREEAMRLKVEERMRKHQEQQKQKEEAAKFAPHEETPEEIAKRKAAAEKLALFFGPK